MPGTQSIWDDFDQLPWEAGPIQYQRTFYRAPNTQNIPRRSKRWLWKRTSRGEWKLLNVLEDSHPCRVLAYCRQTNPNTMFRLTKNHHPPRTITTPETKDPFA